MASLLLAIVLPAVALTGVNSARAEDRITIRLGTILPSGTPQHAALQSMGEQWRKVSGGTVNLILYPDGRLGGESEMVKKMRIKQLNAALLSVVGLSEIDPDVTGLQLMPLVFRSWDEVDFVREKIRPMLEQRLRAKGFEVLFWADAGWVHFFSKEPALTPDDFRKTKIFVWAGDVRESEILKSLGCRPVGLETTDILLGLNTDLINAVPMPPLIALASQLYGPAPHMLDLNWCPIVGAAVIRSEVWNRVPSAIRQQLREIAEVTGTDIRREGRLENDESVRAMQARGLQVRAVPPEAAELWQATAAELRRKMRGTMVPDDIFDEVERQLAVYRHGAGAAGK
jgi:TRAP-type C4-dicarboxylate transport system substrate-binding protein